MNSRRPNGTSYSGGIVDRGICHGALHPNAVFMSFLCKSKKAALEFICLPTHLPAGGAEPRWRRKMTHPAPADHRLPEPARHRQSDRAWPNSLPGNYRFGRTAAKPVRAIARRSARGAKRFFGAMLKIIAEAKLRRLARELSIRGVRYPSVRLEGDRFVADQDRSPSK